MTEMSTTRGLPFEPDAAIALRAASQARAAAQARREEADRRRQERRDYGKMLDEIETSYRQHRPPQQQDWR